MNHLDFNSSLLFDRTKADFVTWLQEQSGNLFPDEIEAVFAGYMYRDVVSLHRDHDATNDTIGAYVKMLNDYIEYQLGYIHFRQEFTKIKPSEEPKRTLLLSGLMDKLQSEFEIPLLNDSNWNAANPEIIDLYRAISTAHDL